MRRFLMAAIVAMFCAGPVEAASTDADPGGARSKGEAIAREVDRRDAGFTDSRASVEMILRDAGGGTSSRKLRVMIKEVIDEEDGDKVLIEFESPRDVSGTKLLSFSHFNENDDQWLFLPALRRVKRISSSNKAGPFVGSEFAYEDMLSQEHQRYRHEWLRDEPCGEARCFVVERRPRDENSGYTRQVVWVDQQHYRPMRIDYYDRKDVLLKTLTYSGYRQYLERYWRAHELTMTNHQNRKSTVLRIDSYRFRTGLQESALHPARLAASR